MNNVKKLRIAALVQFMHQVQLKGDRQIIDKYNEFAGIALGCDEESLFVNRYINSRKVVYGVTDVLRPYYTLALIHKENPLPINRLMNSPLYNRDTDIEKVVEGFMITLDSLGLSVEFKGVEIAYSGEGTVDAIIQAAYPDSPIADSTDIGGEVVVGGDLVDASKTEGGQSEQTRTINWVDSKGESVDPYDGKSLVKEDQTTQSTEPDDVEPPPKDPAGPNAPGDVPDDGEKEKEKEVKSSKGKK